MFIYIAQPLLALAYMCANSFVGAQDTAFHFTSGVTNPAPAPGEPFLITWTGGQSAETVYIVLNYLFPDTPNQDTSYINTDILSNAPNNGSWTYYVPENIASGRYTFSIGQNPFLLSDSTDIFTIVSTATSPAVPVASVSNTAAQSYSGCGLPPLPDFTYTAYQAPCTITTNGQVETIFPIVPAADSSSFFGSIPSASTTETELTSSFSQPSLTASPTFDPAFAPGAFAQALQCPVTVTPTTTKITASGTTTILSSIGCSTVSATTSAGSDEGVCHSSGYTTYSVSGASSVCCPMGWAITPLVSELFCFTSFEQEQKSALVEKRQVSTETLAASPSPLLAISGLVITKAGVVHGMTGASTGSGSSPAVTASATSDGGTSRKSFGGAFWKLSMAMILARMLCGWN